MAGLNFLLKLEDQMSAAFKSAGVSAAIFTAQLTFAEIAAEAVTDAFKEVIHAVEDLTSDLVEGTDTAFKFGNAMTAMGQDSAAAFRTASNEAFNAGDSLKELEGDSLRLARANFAPAMSKDIIALSSDLAGLSGHHENMNQMIYAFERLGLYGEGAGQVVRMFATAGLKLGDVAKELGSKDLKEMRKELDDGTISIDQLVAAASRVTEATTHMGLGEFAEKQAGSLEGSVGKIKEAWEEATQTISSSFVAKDLRDVMSDIAFEVRNIVLSPAFLDGLKVAIGLADALARTLDLILHVVDTIMPIFDALIGAGIGFATAGPIGAIAGGGLGLSKDIYDAAIAPPKHAAGPQGPQTGTLVDTLIGAGIGFATAGPIGAAVGGGLGLGKDIYDATVPKHAAGGITQGPQTGTIGEAGPEAILPLSGDNDISKMVGASALTAYQLFPENNSLLQGILDSLDNNFSELITIVTPPPPSGGGASPPKAWYDTQAAHAIESGVISAAATAALIWMTGGSGAVIAGGGAVSGGAAAAREAFSAPAIKEEAEIQLDEAMRKATQGDTGDLFKHGGTLKEVIKKIDEIPTSGSTQFRQKVDISPEPGSKSGMNTTIHAPFEMHIHVDGQAGDTQALALALEDKLPSAFNSFLEKLAAAQGAA